MVQTALSGLEAGSWFALLGLAIVVVMKAADVPNFAMAEIGLVATYVGTVVNAGAANFWVAVVVTLLGGAVLAVAIDLLLMRRLAKHGHFPLLLMTIGLSLALNALIGLIWGHDPRSFTAPWSGSYFTVAGFEISWAQVVTIAVGAAGAIAITWFFRTSTGAQMRAVAENRATARLVGVNAGRLSAIAWGVGGLIAAMAVMLQAQSTLVSTHSAASLIIYGFVAATMGGFVSLIGTFAGGLALGVIQQTVGAYVSGTAQFAVALLAVVIVLLVRPDGFTKGVRLRDV
ncbi:branched-chain amino acid ABC transporter permease [Pseudonocardia broussonetiae]|uniref:Branched-chain amino acid ABC transporter permease n=1 Tax=Pseudonocardia broussonetiae TaxID=2736640 RepID=A0A6M6JNY7_9PSEU|nr:branched-chain amino acid ABC transporter permease [Pseudonocardia broussonetiae]QJY49648.1 branched-chain amino acid ABC transporter permease [Pseudonocardia broussonetiae]